MLVLNLEAIFKKGEGETFDVLELRVARFLFY